MKTHVWLCLGLAWLAGCSNPAPAPVVESAAPPPVPLPPPPGSARIAGRVTFNGPCPKPEPLDMDSVPACARVHPASALSEDVVIGPGGGLANVYVWVKSGLPNAAWPTPPGNAVIDQEGCIYKPHAVAIQAGQAVEFTNHDAMNHNIHPIPEINAEVNRIQAPQGAPLVERFPLPEVGILVKCNVHPWMRTFVHVAPHPFFALTESDGSFEINGLPEGDYVLEAWHEKFGRKELTLHVSEGERKPAIFTY